MRTGRLLAFGALIMLVGCDQDGPAQDNEAQSTAPASNGTVGMTSELIDMSANATHEDGANGSIRFACDNGQGVVITRGDDSVALLINGTQYVLPGVIAASGTKFMSKSGPTPGKGLTWWSKGANALLIQTPIGDTSGARDETAKCRLAPDAKVQPDIE
ncbi:membrane-bound inhibitor of C-type lysozyme [Sphingomonas sp. UYAg733]